MKIGIYSPYLDTVGGGEKYMLTIAELLSKNYQVDVLLGTHLYDLDIDEFKKKISDLQGIELNRVSFIKAPFWPGSSFINRIFFLRNYDYFFYLTDGSTFFSTAKRSIIHFQVPLKNRSFGLWQKIKLKSWQMAIFNSEFTKEVVEKNWPIRGVTIYPPVSTNLFKPLKKKKQIISVGRFFGYSKVKKQKEMIEIFKKLVDQEKISGWSFHLVGSAGEGDEDYLKELKAIARGYNIYLHPNAGLPELKTLYGESTIYWHMTGFGEEDPAKFEHFGITTVESMAAGCIPVVINQGGQKEIVENGVSGYLWNDVNELKNLTLKVINNSLDNDLLSKSAQLAAKKFSKEEFEKKITDLINK